MNDLEIVVATQKYIKLHHNDVDFSIENICNSIGYSRRQLDRLSSAPEVKKKTLSAQEKCPGYTIRGIVFHHQDI